MQKKSLRSPLALGTKEQTHSREIKGTSVMILPRCAAEKGEAAVETVIYPLIRIKLQDPVSWLCFSVFLWYAKDNKFFMTQNKTEF